MSIPEPLARDPRQATLLVVDDEEANLELLREFLADDGYRNVTTEQDSGRVEALFQQLRPDLLLLDLHMAPLDGFTVMERLRARIPEDEYFPILVLTADATHATRLRALSGGASDFLTKPLDEVEVLLRIRNLLQTRMLYLREREARRRAEAARRRAAFLAEASRVLALSFDTRSMLATLARLAVPEVADACVVDLAGADGRMQRAAAAHADPECEALLCAADGLWGGVLPLEHPLVRQLTDGQFVLLNDVESELGGYELEGAAHELLLRLAPRSVASVPLVSVGRFVGSVTLVGARGGRTLDADDLALAEELARRILSALDGAQLYHDALHATRARDEILGVVAHDLRNPLNTIRMAVQLLEEDAPQAQRRTLGTLSRAAGRMDGLIQDLLEVTRIESGRLTLERRPESVRVLLAEAKSMLGPLAQARSLVLEVLTDQAVPDVPMDVARVLQVISNLVGNAIKFTPAGGRITLACEPDAEGVRFRVADTGPGIPADQLSRVFSRFWQAGKADRRGVGLGLSIARGIVEAHGGRIWVESEEGEGSTFYFTLPASAESGAESDRAAAAPLPRPLELAAEPDAVV